MSNNIIVAQRLALKDADLATRANLKDAVYDFNYWKKKIAKEEGLSDDALYNRIKEKAYEHLETKTCFVAGTLVHTKEGLRPIETIKVGDYVLSKPENGGELAYKRVTKTFVRENTEVWGVKYGYALNKAAVLVTTAEHPFWVSKLSVKDPSVKFGGMYIPHEKWVTAEDMFKTDDNYYKGKGEFANYYLSSFDGKEYPASATPICMATDNPNNNTLGYAGSEFGVLWEVTSDPQRRQEARGGGVDFRTMPPQYIRMLSLALNKKSRNTDKDTWIAGSTEYFTRGYQPKRCTVYNLEVEDYHTYFVGEHGIWVHNTCAELFKALPEAKTVAETTKANVTQHLHLPRHSECNEESSSLKMH